MSTSSLVVLNKPTRGEPCNRCGLCCTRELCSIAMDRFRPGHGPYGPEWRGVCPALSFDEQGVSTCGLIGEVDEKLQVSYLAAEIDKVQREIDQAIAKQAALRREMESIKIALSYLRDLK